MKSVLHTLHISGHAIISATLITASGFLALAFSNLPQMRQFGIVSAIAFGFSMLADFTALPAALCSCGSGQTRRRPEGPSSSEEFLSSLSRT